jgi:hypothetical protein
VQPSVAVYSRRNDQISNIANKFTINTDPGIEQPVYLYHVKSLQWAKRLVFLGLLVMICSSCGKVRGPRGLRQSEWVAYCTANPSVELCSIAPLDWPEDSFYLRGLIFEPNFIQEYRCDTVAGDIICQLFDINPTGSVPEIQEDTIQLVTPTGNVGLFGYLLEDGMLIITSANPAYSQIEPGTIFTNVKQIPDNYPAIVELP